MYDVVGIRVLGSCYTLLFFRGNGTKGAGDGDGEGVEIG